MLDLLSRTRTKNTPDPVDCFEAAPIMERAYSKFAERRRSHLEIEPADEECMRAAFCALLEHYEIRRKP